MGLDLLPRRSNRLDETVAVPPGMTHRAHAPCPFANDGFPLGPMGTCCSLRGKVAAENLDALGEHDDCKRMHESMDAAEALQFAATLRATASRLEQRHAGQKEKPTGGARGGMIDADTGEFTPWPQPSFEEALASVLQAADWYEKVGRLGFGVHAWY